LRADKPNAFQKTIISYSYSPPRVTLGSGEAIKKPPEKGAFELALPV